MQDDRVFYKILIWSSIPLTVILSLLVDKNYPVPIHIPFSASLIFFLPVHALAVYLQSLFWGFETKNKRHILVMKVFSFLTALFPILVLGTMLFELTILNKRSFPIGTDLFKYGWPFFVFIQANALGLMIINSKQMKER